jgi:hypothetical protein
MDSPNPFQPLSHLKFNRRDALRFGFGTLGAFGAMATGAFQIPARAYASKDFWETKQPAQWSGEEADLLLTKSPWAKEVSATFTGNGGGFGGGNGGGRQRGGMGGGIGGMGGGIGGMGGGIGGMGGGIGGMGGGRQRGSNYPGGNYPGGGGNYPGGNNGDGRGDGRREGQGGFRGTVRWDSALPIRLALAESRDKKLEDPKPDSDLTKYYIVHLLGELPMLGGGPRRRNVDSRNSRFPDDRSPDDRARDEQQQADDDGERINQTRLDTIQDNTRLDRKQGFLRPEKVVQGSRVDGLGSGLIFYFSRLDDIGLNDKEVTFVTKLGPLEVKTKFVLKDMVYQGHLAL